MFEALSSEFRGGVPWVLLYADDRAVMTDSPEECVTKQEAWNQRDGELACRKPRLWCLDQEWTFFVTPVHSHVLSVGVVLEKMPSSAHNAICGYIRNVAMSAEDLKLTQML